MSARIQPADILDLLRPDMTVFIAGGMGEPRTLTEALQTNPDASDGVHYVQTRLPGFEGPDLSEVGSKITTFFMTRDLRAAAAAGRVDFVPMQYRDIYEYLREGIAIDLALIQLAPPGSRGECSHGLSVDFVPAVLENARSVVAEINGALPAPVGAPRVPVAKIGSLVESNRALPLLASTQSEEAAGIAAHVATLIRDGDCLQTGIGTIPDAVLGELHDRRDLGFHSGMLSDGVLALVESGALTGSAKSIDTGKIVTGFVAGSEDLYAWATRAPELLFRSVDYTHDVRVLAEIDNFVAINSAVEVDLFGQVNAEMIDGRQISGTGGAVDFMRGAARSKRGRSIVALAATARKGAVSRIVPALSAGTVATGLRTDVDYVVSEHGVARLRGLGVEARAEALTAIAAPRFREELVSVRRRMTRTPGGGVT